MIELAEKACLKKIFVNKKLRNNGFGSILLKYIINWLMNNNFDSLVVEKHKQMNNFLLFSVKNFLSPLTDTNESSK